MIELLWREQDKLADYNVMMHMTFVIAWLTSRIDEDEKNHDIQLNGYVTLNDPTKERFARISSLILCNKKDEKKILEILQQPPTEYREKYIARVVCEEPNPVVEQTNEKNDAVDVDDSGNIEET